MSALRVRSLWLLVFCLVILAAPSTATAKKPPPTPDDPPPPAPVEYQVVWLDGSSVNEDINSAGTIVGFGGDGAVCRRFENGWAIEDLNDNEFVSAAVGGGSLRSANCINNAGLIAGSYSDADGIRHVYVFDPVVGTLWILGYSGLFSVRDMNEEGTVVGYFVDEEDVSRRQGFVWHHDKGFLLLPEDYVLSGINDSEGVVGIILGRSLTGEVFRWGVNWEDPDSVTNAERLGVIAHADNYRYGQPAISSDGTIAAASKRLLPGPDEDWEELAEGINGVCLVSNINAQGQICGVLKLKKPRDFDPGFVYDAQAEQFWMLDDRIVHDEMGLWPNGVVYPIAVADESEITAYNGFSTIVGGDWVLVPGPPPE